MPFGTSITVAGTTIVFHQSAHDSYWALHQWDSQDKLQTLIFETSDLIGVIDAILDIAHAASHPMEDPK